MKNTLIRVSILAVVLCLSILTQRGVRAQETPPGRYFPETGHWVRDEFLTRYELADDPLLVYGFPLTEAFFDADSGRMVQYFEKARFELFPDAPTLIEKVKLTPLGSLLYVPGKPLPRPANYPGCKDFSEVEGNFAVCYDFLEFFEAHGGVGQFGYPISNFEIHNGWISQYFQRARFEWHPELPAGERVQIANLGKEYFISHGEDPALLRPVPGDMQSARPVLSLKAYAFVSPVSLPYKGGEQTLYVKVYDQALRPVEGAKIHYQVTLPSGATYSGTLPPTDADGLSSNTHIIPADEHGRGIITITITYDLVQGYTATVFHLW